MGCAAYYLQSPLLGFVAPWLGAPDPDPGSVTGEGTPPLLGALTGPAAGEGTGSLSVHYRITRDNKLSQLKDLAIPEDDNKRQLTIHAPAPLQVAIPVQPGAEHDAPVKILGAPQIPILQERTTHSNAAFGFDARNVCRHTSTDAQG